MRVTDGIAHVVSAGVVMAMVVLPQDDVKDENFDAISSSDARGCWMRNAMLERKQLSQGRVGSLLMLVSFNPWAFVKPIETLNAPGAADVVIASGSM